MFTQYEAYEVWEDVASRLHALRRREQLTCRMFSVGAYHKLYACREIFTHVEKYLRMSRNLYACREIFTHVEKSLRTSRNIYACREIFTYVENWRDISVLLAITLH
jgi:hypothetical protein